MKSEIRNRRLDFAYQRRTVDKVQFKVSDFGFEVQDSSNFKIPRSLAPRRLCLRLRPIGLALRGGSFPHEGENPLTHPKRFKEAIVPLVRGTARAAAQPRAQGVAHTGLLRQSPQREKDSTAVAPLTWVSTNILTATTRLNRLLRFL